MLKENIIPRKRRGRAKSRRCNNAKSDRVTRTTHPTNPRQRVKQFAQSDIGPQLKNLERQTVQKRIISRQKRQGSEHLVRTPEPPKYCGPPQVRCAKLWGQRQGLINHGLPTTPRLPPGIVTTSVLNCGGDSIKIGVNSNQQEVDLWHQPTPPTTAAWTPKTYSAATSGKYPPLRLPKDTPAARLKKLCIAASSGLPVIQANELVMRYHTPSPPPVATAPPVYLPSHAVYVPPDADKCHMEIFSKIDSGMFFICNEETEKEVFDLKLFALPAEYLEVMQEVTDTTALFLYRKSSTNPVIYGVFLRDGPAKLNIVESAFGNRYPAQIRFKELYRFPALPEHLLCKEERYQYYPGQRKKLYRVQPQYGSMISKSEIEKIINDFYQNRLNLAVE